MVRGLYIPTTCCALDCIVSKKQVCCRRSLATRFGQQGTCEHLCQCLFTSFMPTYGSSSRMISQHVCMHARFGLLPINYKQVRGGQLHPQMATAIPVASTEFDCQVLVWSLLCECGIEPIRLHWFQKSVRLYNSLIHCNRTLLQQVIPC